MDVSRREKSSLMNKMIKKLSAVAIAAAMTLSTGVAAQAATLKVYFREWHQGTTSNTYLGTEDLTTFGTEPVLEVSGVESTITYKQLQLRQSIMVNILLYGIRIMQNI